MKFPAINSRITILAAALASAQLASGVTLDGTTAARMNDPTPKPPR